MNGKLKKYLPWIIRIFIFLLFMISAFSKMFPVWAFEKQLVDVGITSWCHAHFLARLIIAGELAIGIAILQPHYLRSIVIPVTVLLLVAFNAHLFIEMVDHGPMSGNCGCFGQVIPMTPLEAFIKNIILIALLVYLFFIVRDKEKGQNKFFYLIFLYLATSLFMFIVFPFCPCKNIDIGKATAGVRDAVIHTVGKSDSSFTVIQAVTGKEASVNGSDPPKDTVIAKPAEKGPAKTRSRFAQFTSFGDKTVNLDEGKKILCFFAPGCDHCQETAREIGILSRTTGFPPVYILFMNEEADKIPEFFSFANHTFPYKIIDIPVFWDLLGSSANTPGVFLLWNGNIIKFYEGEESNQFDPEDLRKVL
jgi:uncharacterized membrane protein YphA (DoxX/SURF4 family)